jgi:hypothetical protein
LGAAGVIIYNNFGGEPLAMGGSSHSVNIPVFMVALDTGVALRDAFEPPTVGLRVIVNKDSTLLQYNNWPFASMRNWGEPANGDWTLTVADKFGAPSSQGDFVSWNLVLWNNVRSSGSPVVVLPPTTTTTTPYEWVYLVWFIVIASIILVMVFLAVMVYLFQKKKCCFGSRSNSSANTSHSGRDHPHVNLEEDIWDEGGIDTAEDFNL